MGKRTKFKEYQGLSHLSTTTRGRITDKNGDIVTVVHNGLLGGELFFNAKTRQVYAVDLVDITHLANEETLDDFAAQVRIREAIPLVTLEWADRILGQDKQQ